MKLLQRGDVVALRRGRSAVVLSITQDVLTLVPVFGTNGRPRHRAEVRIEDLADILACGLAMKLPALQCHQFFDLPISRLAKPAPIGRTPAILMSKIVRAVTREAQAQADEARMAWNRAA